MKFIAHSKKFEIDPKKKKKKNVFLHHTCTQENERKWFFFSFFWLQELIILFLKRKRVNYLKHVPKFQKDKQNITFFFFMTIPTTPKENADNVYNLKI